MSDAIAYATIRELGGHYRKRELSPVEVTRTLLGRIEQLDPMLHAFITLTADRAMADARAAEAALQRGDARPLLGIPVAHKDIYCTRGIRTTGGSALLADWLPEDNATCVRRWQEAGTVLLGKLITHEFAFGLQLPGHRFQPARNPWNIAHIPGGLEQWLRRCPRCRTCCRRHRLGYWWLHPWAGSLLRHCRAQAHLRACQSCRLLTHSWSSTTPARCRARSRTAHML